MDPGQITGLVLAGGEGRRMGGIDKGLLALGDVPLARRAAQRLSPQVGGVMISANRNLDEYEGWGFPVHADTVPGSLGPLAGLLAGLTHCPTPWLVSVPCDVPGFPVDLVARLAAAVTDDRMAAVIAGVSGTVAPISRQVYGSRSGPAPRDMKRGNAAPLRLQPVFCLVRQALTDDLADYLAAGERRFGGWLARLQTEVVAFEDAAAFANINTPEDLASLQTL